MRVKMAKKTRKDPNPLQKKKLQQEADSCCPFCGNTEAGTWIFHHIDGDPSHTVLDNLIMICGACHERITKGEISEADVRLKKNMIAWGYKQRKAAKSKNIKNEANGNVGCTIRQTIQIGNLPPNRVAPAPDSIGENAKAKNYAKYLAEKLCEYRMKNKVFLSEEERKQETGSYMAVIWKNVKTHFKVTSYSSISLDNKDKLFQYLQKLINNTTQGKINRGKGYKSYLLFSEYDG